MTTTETAVSTPHALAIELLTREAEILQRQQLQHDRIWRKALQQPASKYSPEIVDEAEAVANANRDRHARIRESIAALRKLQRAAAE